MISTNELYQMSGQHRLNFKCELNSHEERFDFAEKLLNGLTN